MKRKPTTKKPAAKTAKRKAGRPTKRTPEVVAEILRRLATGEPMTIICAGDDMPDARKVREWQEEDAALSADIARAREAGFDQIARDALAIADSAEGDTQRDKLRVDTRLKLLAKWDPKRYGEKLDLAHSGSVDIEVTIGGDDAE